MSYDIRSIHNINHLIMYFSKVLNWDIDVDSFDDIDDISYDFSASDLGLKEEAFAKIKSIKQLPPMVDGQKWGIFCIEFDSKRFEVTALRKVLSGLVPSRRNSADHAVWSKENLLFLCFWGEDNNRTIGVAHFEDKQDGLPQIKMTYCAPAIEDTIHIQDFVVKIGNLAWPIEVYNYQKWHDDWSKAFTVAYKQNIYDSETLTMQLAKEAIDIRDRILGTLRIETSDGYVHKLFDKFKNTLIHDMTEQQFADMYAQTVVYGLFSARCMDKSQENFSAEEAVECIPNTNPFLKNLMRECFGAKEDSKVSFDELEIGNVVDLLTHTKTDEIIRDFNRQTGRGREDTVIYFYEKFLAAYDKTQKVQRGVYYTPQPVVNFMVRVVDELLKSEFGLDDGLASTDTKKIKITRQSKIKTDGYYYKMVEDTIDVPAVQVLDPATGTGTFIRQTILQIYENFKSARKNLSESELRKAWNEYVPLHLLPRLNAFELMMAPYAVAHMKLALVLKDTGYEFDSSERLNVYLTNTLEEAGNSDKQIALWDDPIAMEAIEANGIKNNKGINIVIGNPPYSFTSSNRGKWILDLVSEYKEDLHERKIHLDDDYIKFIRYGQYVIETGKRGILAYITNNSYIDGLTHRVMRKKLLECFDSIYVLNLHGDSKKVEVAPDGSKDENVFDIQQGVSIVFMIKKNANKTDRLADTFYSDLYGLRQYKNDFLIDNDLSSCEWKKLNPIEPSFFFVPKDFSALEKYNEGFALNDVFDTFSQGILSGNDSGVMRKSKDEACELADALLASKSIEESQRIMFDGCKMPKHWDLGAAINDIAHEHTIQRIQYRPFDNTWTAYTETSCGWLWRPRAEVMNSLVEGLDNKCLICTRAIQKGEAFTHAFVSDCVTDKGMLSSKDNCYSFPLFLYQDEFNVKKKACNFNQKFLQKFADTISISFENKISFSEDVFAYIYAFLYSNNYRNKYKHFLKSEFPKIPYPESAESFDAISELGKNLIDLHLMKETTNDCECSFIGEDCQIDKVMYKNNSVYINKSSYFSNVNEEMYDFFVGSYQPLQKWLKDRNKKALSEEDIKQYICIVNAIAKTINIMAKIDEIITEC